MSLFDWLHPGRRDRAAYQRGLAWGKANPDGEAPRGPAGDRDEWFQVGVDEGQQVARRLRLEGSGEEAAGDE